MRYLIDGYNLLHAMGLLAGKAGPHGLEKARLALLGRLCGEHGENAAAVTVVFDASGAPKGAVPDDEYQGIHIRYALESEADDVIETLIRHDPAPQQLTVVSDDHRLQQAALRRRCRALGCMNYLDEMEARRRIKPVTTEVAAKPESISDDEKKHWMREFAELVDDPQVRDVLGPDFTEKDAE